MERALVQKASHYFGGPPSPFRFHHFDIKPIFKEDDKKDEVFMLVLTDRLATTDSVATVNTSIHDLITSLIKQQFAGWFYRNEESDVYKTLTVFGEKLLQQINSVKIIQGVRLSGAGFLCPQKAKMYEIYLPDSQGDRFIRADKEVFHDGMIAHTAGRWHTFWKNLPHGTELELGVLYMHKTVFRVSSIDVVCIKKYEKNELIYQSALYRCFHSRYSAVYFFLHLHFELEEKKGMMKFSVADLNNKNNSRWPSFIRTNSEYVCSRWRQLSQRDMTEIAEIYQQDGQRDVADLINAVLLDENCLPGASVMMMCYNSPKDTEFSVIIATRTSSHWNLILCRGKQTFVHNLKAIAFYSALICLATGMVWYFFGWTTAFFGSACVAHFVKKDEDRVRIAPISVMQYVAENLIKDGYLAVQNNQFVVLENFFLKNVK